MPIKIFESTNTQDLETQVNEFIENNKVLHISASSSTVGEMLPTKYQVLVQYEDKK